MNINSVFLVEDTSKVYEWNHRDRQYYVPSTGEVFVERQWRPTSFKIAKPYINRDKIRWRLLTKQYIKRNRFLGRWEPSNE